MHREARAEEPGAWRGGGVRTVSSAACLGTAMALLTVFGAGRSRCGGASSTSMCCSNSARSPASRAESLVSLTGAFLPASSLPWRVGICGAHLSQRRSQKGAGPPGFCGVAAVPAGRPQAGQEVSVRAKNFTPWKKFKRSPIWDSQSKSTSQCRSASSRSSRGRFKNQLPGSARFQVQCKSESNHQVVLVFNSRLVDEAGLGSNYRSADLYWSEETAEILLRLRGGHGGARRVWRDPKRHTATVSVTMFLLHFRIRFQEHVRYRAFQDGPDEVIVDLQSAEPSSTRRLLNTSTTWWLLSLLHWT